MHYILMDAHYITDGIHYKTSLNKCKGRQFESWRRDFFFFSQPILHYLSSSTYPPIDFFNTDDMRYIYSAVYAILQWTHTILQAVYTIFTGGIRYITGDIHY